MCTLTLMSFVRSIAFVSVKIKHNTSHVLLALFDRRPRFQKAADVAHVKKQQKKINFNCKCPKFVTVFLADLQNRV